VPAAGSVEAKIEKKAPARLFTQSYSPTTRGRGGLAEEMMNVQYPTLNIQGRSICAELHHWLFLVGSLLSG
jgi:hypothetical protein